MMSETVAKMETVKVTLDIPKPIMDFFNVQVQFYGNEKNTIEKFVLSALVEAVDASLNDLDCKCRNNIVKNLKLDQLIK